MISRCTLVAAVSLLLVSGVAQAHEWGGDWSQRHFLHRLHEACEDGDRRACIRFGIKLGEYRQRREEQRQLQPNYGRWWEYRDYPGWRQQ